MYIGGDRASESHWNVTLPLRVATKLTMALVRMGAVAPMFALVEVVWSNTTVRRFAKPWNGQCTYKRKQGREYDDKRDDKCQVSESMLASTRVLRTILVLVLVGMPTIAFGLALASDVVSRVALRLLCLPCPCCIAAVCCAHQFHVRHG